MSKRPMRRRFLGKQPSYGVVYFVSLTADGPSRCSAASVTFKKPAAPATQLRRFLFIQQQQQQQHDQEQKQKASNTSTGGVRSQQASDSASHPFISDDAHTQMRGEQRSLASENSSELRAASEQEASPFSSCLPAAAANVATTASALFSSIAPAEGAARENRLARLHQLALVNEAVAEPTITDSSLAEPATSTSTAASDSQGPPLIDEVCVVATGSDVGAIVFSAM